MFTYSWICPYILHKSNKNDIGEIAKGQWRPERAFPFEPKLNKNIKMNIFYHEYIDKTNKHETNTHAKNHQK